MRNRLKIINSQSSYFDLISYPDGQRSIKLRTDKLNIKHNFVIDCHAKNFIDLEVLGCLLAALHKNDYYVQHLHFDYLFGIRSDRAFETGEPNYCRDVLAPIINNWLVRFNIRSMSILWPFQPLPMKNNYFKDGYAVDKAAYSNNVVPSDLLRIGGDETAGFFEGRPTDANFIKTRDNGKINVSLSEYFLNRLAKEGKAIIVDDLCDGGATFIAEAKYLKQLLPDIQLDLFVYHGLFTKGFDELLTYFNTIYCTDSYQTINHPRIIQI